MSRLGVDLDCVSFHTLHDEEHMSSYMKNNFEFSSVSQLVDPLLEDGVVMLQLVMYMNIVRERAYFACFRQTEWVSPSG
jgi:hypothetical protein